MRYVFCNTRNVYVYGYVTECLLPHASTSCYISGDILLCSSNSKVGWGNSDTPDTTVLMQSVAQTARTSGISLDICRLQPPTGMSSNPWGLYPPCVPGR